MARRNNNALYIATKRNMPHIIRLQSRSNRRQQRAKSGTDQSVVHASRRCSVLFRSTWAIGSKLRVREEEGRRRRIRSVLSIKRLTPELLPTRATGTSTAISNLNLPSRTSLTRYPTAGLAPSPLWLAVGGWQRRDPQETARQPHKSRC